MIKLPKYTLEYDEKDGNWDLTRDKSNRTIKTFDTKENATSKGTLGKAVGREGGSIKYRK